jgi:hypothetical protein
MIKGLVKLDSFVTLCVPSSRNMCGKNMFVLAVSLEYHSYICLNVQMENTYGNGKPIRCKQAWTGWDAEYI